MGLSIWKYNQYQGEKKKKSLNPFNQKYSTEAILLIVWLEFYIRHIDIRTRQNIWE